MQGKEGLVRSLGLGSAVAVTAGSVIGSGVFLVASDIAQRVPSPTAALSVWLTAGVLSLVGGLIFAELGAMFPKAGGQYVYLKEAFPPWVAFLYGWTVVLIIQSGSIAAVAVAIGRFLSRLLPLSSAEVTWVAVVSCTALTALNAFGVRKAALVLDSMTALKALALVGVGALALLPFTSPAPALENPLPATFGWTDYGVALIAAFWAYDGWNNLGYVAGELRDPKRNIPLASFLGIAGVALLYLGANYTYYRALSPAEIAASPFVAADALAKLLGSGWIPLVTGLVVFSSLGCVNGLILGGARVIYAMGVDGSFPKALGTVNSQHAPGRALWAQCAWSVLLIFSGSYDQLFTYVVFAAFLFYGTAAFTLLWLRRRRPELERPYRVPAYPWLPAGYLAFIVVFTINSVVEKPKESAAGVAIMALGIPLYLWRRRASQGTTE